MLDPEPVGQRGGVGRLAVTGVEGDGVRPHVVGDVAGEAGDGDRVDAGGEEQADGDVGDQMTGDRIAERVTDLARVDGPRRASRG